MHAHGVRMGMMDPDYVIGIIDAMLTQADYLKRLSDKTPELRGDLLQNIHDSLNDYKIKISVAATYEPLRLRALRLAFGSLHGLSLQKVRPRQVVLVHGDARGLRPIRVPLRGDRGMAPHEQEVNVYHALRRSSVGGTWPLGHSPPFNFSLMRSMISLLSTR